MVSSSDVPTQAGKLPPSPSESASSAMPANASATHSPNPNAKSKRVLACLQCQHRKIKCERQFPCSNCIRTKSQCVPAGMIDRPRKRRFPERQLLDRLRLYEDLLRKHGVDFEPLHKEVDGGREGQQQQQQQQQAAQSWEEPEEDEPAKIPEAKDFWKAVKDWFRHSDGRPSSTAAFDAMPKFPSGGGPAMDLWLSNGRFVFDALDAGTTTADYASLRPEPVQVFRLWQIYIDNVDPLLKVTHIPTLQPRIIEAMGDAKRSTPTLEALMCGIYCMAVNSLRDAECRETFGAPKKQLMHKFRCLCQQALCQAEYLRTTDRDCLTAWYFYLLSIGHTTDTRTLSSMLAVAMRIARRMGLHAEAELAKCSVLEAEMRRRLWWSLSMFETRIAEMAEHKITGLSTDWDCRLPLNVNDADLRPEMKEPPRAGVAQLNKTSEAFFSLVRCELASFFRNCHHLRLDIDRDLDRDATRAFTRQFQASLAALEKLVDDRYLRHCDPENPLHTMAICATRSHIARCRLMERYMASASSVGSIAEAERDASITQTFIILECDTTMMTNPLLVRFRWLLDIYFPLPAYIHLLLDVKRRPTSPHAERAWEIMSANYEARFTATENPVESPMFKFFTGIILGAWEPVAAAEENNDVVPPKIITDIRSQLERMSLGTASPFPSEQFDPGMSDFTGVMPIGFDDNVHAPWAWPPDWRGMVSGLSIYPSDIEMASSGVNQFPWAPEGYGWGAQQNTTYNFDPAM